MIPPPRVVLTIAGSDPSGGAGIQADLRLFQARSLAGVSALSALTAQNTRGVLQMLPVDPKLLAAQIDAVLTDIPVHAVKIGMLGGAEQVAVVAKALRRFRPPHIVLDPILAATDGTALLSMEGRRALVQELVPLADVVTPNAMEAGFFAGVRVTGYDAAAAAARWLLARGAGAVLVKGGHLPGETNDLLFRRESPDAPRVFAGPRIATGHTHGTGCLLSAAIAAGLAIGQTLEEAVSEARQTVRIGLESAVVIGQGRGYPGLPAASAERRGALHEARLARLKGVYVLTDSTLRPDRGPEETARAALAAGASVLQLREKSLPTAELVALARRLSALARATGALFLVNDRVDIALAADADGVHLGPDDLQPPDARRLLGPDRILGVSVSSVEEARPLADVASYFGVGAIFGSSTKTDAGPPVGLERLREIRSAFPGHPIVAIGGINESNIASVRQAGADAAAVISAVVCAPEMTEAVRTLCQRFAAADSRQGEFPC